MKVLRLNFKNNIIKTLCYLLCIFIKSYSGPIAEGADKFLGNIVDGDPPANFLNYWNQLTLENKGKWENIEQNRDQMNWSVVSAAYNFCKKNGIPYKHHTFVWKEQSPKWIENLPPAEQKAEVEELMKIFGEKFPETDFIDVVNEPREKSPTWKSALGGEGKTGYDWLIWCYKTARKYCPKAKLLINEYYCEYNMDYVKQYMKMIKILKDSNLIDGIGIQTHDGETKKGYEMGVLKECIDSLATLGLPIYSSELDLSGTDDEQLEYYKKIFPIIWEHPAIRGVTLWGWTDSWLLHLSNPKDARLIINGKERPALKWLREYVASHKTRLIKEVSINPKKYSIPLEEKNDNVIYSVTAFNLLGRQVPVFEFYHKKQKSFTIIKIKEDNGSNIKKKVDVK